MDRLGNWQSIVERRRMNPPIYTKEFAHYMSIERRKAFKLANNQESLATAVYNELDGGKVCPSVKTILEWYNLFISHDHHFPADMRGFRVRECFLKRFNLVPKFVLFMKCERQLTYLKTAEYMDGVIREVLTRPSIQKLLFQCGLLTLLHR